MNVLSIGGSDPSSGAGIQSDIKTFENHEVFGFTVITAITSQNSQKVSDIEPISPKIIKSQLNSIFSDFKIDAVLISMVYNSSIIRIVNSIIKKQKLPVIVDPVITSTTKSPLIKKSAINDYKNLIIPLATVITPNKEEAKKLTGFSSVKNSAKKLQKLGAKNVIVTSSRQTKTTVEDFIVEGEDEYIIKGKKLKIDNHGSGCNFSASVASSIANKKSIHDSALLAKEYVYQTIKTSEKLGKGVRITHKKTSSIERKLVDSIDKFKNIKKISENIPECQTNFVFSKNNPRKINDVLGVSGRLVKSGNSVVQAGSLVFGGSHHVASAVIEVSKKFPEIRSALNIKYEKKIISKARKRKLTVLSYDRTKEPKKSKLKENSSIKWGISNCLKSNPPDLIFHKGDFGKEPMIIVFGNEPSDVIKKIQMIR
tara:strand:- start:833 stop:2110 length:1278 start_codon:yes stop_codon:yes gene_type:complete